MKSVAIPVTVVLIAAALALAAFEVLLRAIGYSAPVWYQPDAQLGWTLRPGVSGVYTREGRGFVQVNTEGRRDVEHSVAKPPGVYRIALLGDSYAEAMQVEREHTFWARLPDELRACGFQPGKRIEVLNFGVSGYGTAQEYLLLGSVAMRYHPDMVLLQFTNGNDVRNNSAALEDEKARPFFKFRPDGSLRLDASFATSERFADRSSFVHDVVREVSDHSRVVQLVRNVRTPFVQRAQ